MSWYGSRTDGELVALAAGGDRSARASLVDRTLLPASRVAIHLHDDRAAAVDALVGAYAGTFRDVTRLEDGERFLPVLLARLDATTPFPLDPATHAPLDPVDRDRVRRRVTASRRRAAVPVAAVLVAIVVVALALAGRPTGDPVTVTSTPGGGGAHVADVTPTPGDPTGSVAPAPTVTPSPSGRDDGASGSNATDGSRDAGSGPTELAETR